MFRFVLFSSILGVSIWLERNINIRPLYTTVDKGLHPPNIAEGGVKVATLPLNIKGVFLMLFSGELGTLFELLIELLDTYRDVSHPHPPCTKNIPSLDFG